MGYPDGKQVATDRLLPGDLIVQVCLFYPALDHALLIPETVSAYSPTNGGRNPAKFLIVHKEAFPFKYFYSFEGIEVLEREGLFVYDQEFGWVTPTVGGRICAYGFRDKQGVIKCGIEQAYLNNQISWKKPISCHLFPVRIAQSKRQNLEYVNYEPREDLCKAACALGKKLKVPVYEFLKEALIRKYGSEFYLTLEASAKHLKKDKV